MNLGMTTRRWAGALACAVALSGCPDPTFYDALNDAVGTAAIVVGGAATVAGVTEGNAALAQGGTDLLAQGVVAVDDTGTADSVASSDPSGVGLDQAQGTCPTAPTTREGISECYRAIAAEMTTNADTCAQNAASMSSLTPDPLLGATSGPDTYSQRQSFENCAELNTRGSRYATCVADGILDPSTQYNPLVKACGQRYGFVN